MWPDDPHRGFRAEAEARLEERRRSMEVAALIVDHHLQLLQKRDVKDLARAAHIAPTRPKPGSSSFARWTLGPAASITASRPG